MASGRATAQPSRTTAARSSLSTLTPFNPLTSTRGTTTIADTDADIATAAADSPPAPAPAPRHPRPQVVYLLARARLTTFSLQPVRTGGQAGARNIRRKTRLTSLQLGFPIAPHRNPSIAPLEPSQQLLASQLTLAKGRGKPLLRLEPSALGNPLTQAARCSLPAACCLLPAARPAARSPLSATATGAAVYHPCTL